MSLRMWFFEEGALVHGTDVIEEKHWKAADNGCDKAFALAGFRRVTDVAEFTPSALELWSRDAKDEDDEYLVCHEVHGHGEIIFVKGYPALLTVTAMIYPLHRLLTDTAAEHAAWFKSLKEK